jgi:hypothetical protein
MHSETDQISFEMSEDCRGWPLTVRLIAPSAGWPMSAARRRAPIGAEPAKDPGPALVARLQLQVAPGHVETDGVAVHVLQRIAHGDVAAACSDGDDELDLVVVVGGLARIRHGRIARGVDHRIGRLHEEERRLAVGVLAHLTGMRRVVAAHAEDTVDREALVAAGDAEGVERRNGDGVVHVRQVGWDREDQSRCSRHSPSACCTGRSE